MVAAAKRKAKAQRMEAVAAAGPAPVLTDMSAPAGIPADPRAWTSVNPPLSQWMLDGLAAMGFERMTPVQASTIPLFMANKDVVVEAVTGSGKTLAFLIPVVERLLRAEEQPKKNQVAAIVISPTRELAAQIHTVLLSILAFHGPSAALLEPPSDDVAMSGSDKVSGSQIKPLLLLGGNTSPAQDLRNFLEQSPNLLIGTPGRLNELLSSQHVHCSNDTFEALVLDEADRLLDLGFKETLTKIISRIPKQRRTGLFSASISDAVVGSLVQAGLRNPVKIVVKVRGEHEEKRTPASLDMAFQLAAPSQRLIYIGRLFSPAAASIFPSSQLPLKTIVYFSNCAAVDYYTSLFPSILRDAADAYTIVPLHGKMNPSMRTRNFNKYVTSSSASILLTTDLAARGLDIPEVDLVIQLDAPTDPKVFLHRCGRAGRAGRRGLAILFLSPGREEGYIDFLDVRKTPVLPLLLPASLSEPPTADEVGATVDAMRAVVLKDRRLYEKGMKAFVSHIRALSKHQTASIFRIADIAWKDLADSFALLRMPRMPELKKLGIDKIDLGVEIDLDSQAYKDKAHEKRRQEELAKPKPEWGPLTPEELAKKKKKKKESWSRKTESQETKAARRERKTRRREAERRANMGPEGKAQEEEWMELLEMAKNHRRGKKEEVAEFYKGVD